MRREAHFTHEVAYGTLSQEMFFIKSARYYEIAPLKIVHRCGLLLIKQWVLFLPFRYFPPLAETFMRIIYWNLLATLSTRMLSEGIPAPGQEISN